MNFSIQPNLENDYVQILPLEIMERIPILIMCMNLKKKIGDRIDTLK